LAVLFSPSPLLIYFNLKNTSETLITIFTLPFAAIACVITSGIHTLMLVPVYYTLYKRWEQWKESWTGGSTESTEKQDADAEVAKSD
jgi:hypothetical protein